MDGPVIDEALARRLVDSQFPQWTDLSLSRVTVDGWDNRTFRLGERLTVRLPSGDPYSLQVDKEQRWLPFLGPRLPLPIPVPVARGTPDVGYPYPWSVYRWLDGDIATRQTIADLTRFATTLAGFLLALGRVDPAGGPEPGPHNFYRGGPLTTYADETIRSIDILGDEIRTDDVRRVWDDAVAATCTGAPVWFHGDVAAGNLLVRNHRLAAVIDFGSSGVGDPACDLVIAWTLLNGVSRDAFRSTLGVDRATWARGRGWGLWKALISLVADLEHERADSAMHRQVIAHVVEDHQREGA